jgi:hypothetical protein
MINPPCKKCICLAICKPKYHEILNSDLAKHPVNKKEIKLYAIYRLSDICSLINPYIHSEYALVNPYIYSGYAFLYPIVHFKIWSIHRLMNKGIKN